MGGSVAEPMCRVGGLVAEPMCWVGWSNLILEPTLALIRAQLGFRIQVRAECGNILRFNLYVKEGITS